jgi:hypothetical protein
VQVLLRSARESAASLLPGRDKRSCSSESADVRQRDMPQLGTLCRCVSTVAGDYAHVHAPTQRAPHEQGDETPREATNNDSKPAER